MEETLNPVNAEQGSVVENQTEETAAGESESAEIADQQTETKPAQTQDENAKYAAARRKAEAEKADAVQKAKDEFAVQLAKRAGISNQDREITSASDFESYLGDLEAKAAGIEPETYRKLRENDPEVKQAKEILAKQAQAEKNVQDFKAFTDSFKETTGRNFDFDNAEDKKLLVESKQEADSTGKELTDVFAKHQNKVLAAELASLRAQAAAKEAEAANATASPGSVQTDGAAALSADYISADEFQKNKSNSQWMRDNFTKIVKSRPKWGG